MGAKEEYEARKAAQEARRSEQSEAKKRNVYWFRHPDPVAKFTGWVAIYTLVLAVATIGSGFILYKTDLTLYETLLATQRPWISVEIAPISDLFINPGSMDGQFRFSLKNVGKSPAISVAVTAEIVLESFHTDIPVEQARICKNSITSIFFPSLKAGYMIFPDEKFIQDKVLSVKRSDLDAYLAAREKEWSAAKAPGERPKWIEATIVGCALYRFAFGPEHDVHETGFSVRLRSSPSETPNLDLPIDVSQSRVPLNTLKTDRMWSFSGSYAN